MLTPKEMTMLSTLLSEPHRRYHNLNHIHQCLVELEQYANDNPKFSISQRKLAEVTLWYHDAIYNPYSKENEHNSMLLFERACKVYRGAFTGKDYSEGVISTAILNTARHLETIDFEYQERMTPEVAEVYKVVLDIDLSGFGKDRFVFALNGLNIRDEYYQTPIRDFLKGRKGFYTQLLKRPSLYYTKYFHDKYHAISRQNIEWEMDLLDRTEYSPGPGIWSAAMEETQIAYSR